MPGKSPTSKPSTAKPTTVKPSTVKQYLEALPDDRRAALEAVRKVILENLDPAYEEGIQYGMIGYYVPHKVYPAGYHCDPRQPLPFASIASQKNHMALYLCSLYMDPALTEWFREAWTRGGRKLDMGQGCIRFRKLEDVPLDVVAKVIKRSPATKFIKLYETARPQASRRSAGASGAQEATKKASKKATKTSTRKTSKKAGKKAGRKATGTSARAPKAGGARAGAAKTARRKTVRKAGRLAR